MLSPVMVLIYILPVHQVTMALSRSAVPDVAAMVYPACIKADN